MRLSVGFYFLLLFYMGGCQSRAIKYPAGGYDYLKNITGRDSDYYFLPVRELVPREDSMIYAGEKYFFRSFNEPNLSTKPARVAMFRLIIQGGRIAPVVIILTPQSLIVKEHKKGNAVSPYPEENLHQLSESEQLHYFFLKKFFPFGKRTYVRGRQLYIDSMRSTYPKLSDAAYYQYLMDKVIDKDAGLFEYTTREIPLTELQFESLVGSINASGYWALPFRIECKEEIADGVSVSLEANTNEKYNLVSFGMCTNKAGTEKLREGCNEYLTAQKQMPGSPYGTTTAKTEAFPC